MELEGLLENDNSRKTSKPLVLIIFGSVVGGLAFGLTVLSTPFLFPFFRRVCLPYVPATTQQVQNVLEALKGKSGSLIDLGSGDGRIVLAAARKGFLSTGIELNPWLVLYSKVAALYSGLHREAKFHKYDLWKFNLSPYRNIVIFGVESMMEELEEKFLKELQSGALIIACRFPLSKLTPIQTIGTGVDTVWVYSIR